MAALLSCNEHPKEDLVERKLEVNRELIEKKKKLADLEDKIKIASYIVDNQPPEPMCGHIVAELLELDERRKILLAEVEVLEAQYRLIQPE